MRILERLRAGAWLRRATQPLQRGRVRKALPFLAFALALELLGRFDLGRAADTAGCVGLVGFGMFVLSTRPPADDDQLLIGVRRRLSRWTEPFFVDFGFDLRGTPPLPTRIPRAWSWTIGLSAVALGCLVFTSKFFPTISFEALRSLSGAGFLCGLTALWLTLGFLGVCAWASVLLWLRNEAETREIGIGGMVVRDAAVLVLLSAALYGSWFGSPAVPLIWLVAMLVIWVGIDLATGTSIRRVFRSRAGQLSWTPFGLWVSGMVAPMLFAVCGLVLLAVGDALAGPVGAAPMLATTVLGSFVAWSIALVASVLQLWILSSIALERRVDPANGFRTRIFAEGITARNERQLFQRTVGHFGFLARFAPARRRREEVPVRVTSSVVPHDPWQPTPWPASVAWSELEEDRLHARIRRRDEIQRRRHLIRGLFKAFRELRAEEQQRGSLEPASEYDAHGTWVAPHLWAFPQLLRDRGEAGALWMGPHFRHVIPQSARAHMHRVLNAVEVDMIFVEEGIDFRRFRRVLRMLFEFYDLFGRRPLEERHFTGLPGIKVILHDSSLDEPYLSDVYLEPGADELGRGRVLHVFRDRGADGDRVELTPDQSLVPSAPQFA